MLQNPHADNTHLGFTISFYLTSMLDCLVLSASPCSFITVSVHLSAILPILCLSLLQPQLFFGARMTNNSDIYFSCAHNILFHRWNFMNRCGL